MKEFDLIHAGVDEKAELIKREKEIQAMVEAREYFRRYLGRDTGMAVFKDLDYGMTQAHVAQRYIDRSVENLRIDSRGPLLLAHIGDHIHMNQLEQGGFAYRILPNSLEKDIFSAHLSDLNRNFSPSGPMKGNILRVHILPTHAINVTETKDEQIKKIVPHLYRGAEFITPRHMGDRVLEMIQVNSEEQILERKDKAKDWSYKARWLDLEGTDLEVVTNNQLGILATHRREILPHHWRKLPKLHEGDQWQPWGMVPEPAKPILPNKPPKEPKQHWLGRLFPKEGTS